VAPHQTFISRFLAYVSSQSASLSLGVKTGQWSGKGWYGKWSYQTGSWRTAKQKTQHRAKYEGILQRTQKAVALPPVIADPLVALNDECINTEHSKPSSDGKTALASTDDDDLRLVSVDVLLVLLAADEPRFTADVVAVVDALGARGACFLFVADQLFDAHVEEVGLKSKKSAYIQVSRSVDLPSTLWS
jgi:hypothetical protein